MSEKRPRRRRPRIRVTRDDNEVGFCRPPRAHQYRPGQSGNPSGRPRGKKNEATILRELLYRKIPLHQAGRTRKITVLEAILLRFTEDALKGNTKSAAFLLNRQSALSSGEPPPSDISDDDNKILEAFAQRVLAQGLNGRSP